MNATLVTERATLIEADEAETEPLRSQPEAEVIMEEVKVEEIEEEKDVAKYAPAKRAKKRNLNVEAAYLHVLGDLLNSIGVILAATIILIWPNLWYVDPICTYIFALIAVYTTIKTFGRCIATFLEATPENIDYDEIQRELLRIPGVDEVHDLHIWSIS